MIKIENEKMPYDIMVATAFSEITESVLTDLLVGVVVPEHYACIALVYTDKLFSVVSNVKNNKSSMVKCVPVLVKLNGDKKEVQGCQIMDRPIISISAIERSNLVIVKENMLDPTTVGRYCQSDPELIKAILTGSYFNDGTTSDFKAKELSPECYFVDFRIVPVNEIVGAYKQNVTPHCAFKIPKVEAGC